MATGSGVQMDTQQHVNESALQWKSCRCGEGDGNLWAARTTDNHDKHGSTKCPNCQVFKSGPLFISSKGLGWTSWKKRWFILTRTSLVFFRNDPNVPIQKGSEANHTLGGIELNSSGSVVVRADKKLLTVLFPDGRDGRAFTLKAETSEDMHEWKTALENALVQAPNAALVMGQNSIFRNDMLDTVEGSIEPSKDKRTVKSTVIGRPVLLALEDIDGNPSFLEKALRFIEQYGVKVEGILRQAADVEEVERRVEEYEQGKDEFSPNEDAHVVGDCIKHVLRGLPSSPVPASCCTALLEAFRSDRGARVNNMRTVIFETFPEPNRRLLQRILQMMQVVASHISENRMSVSAVAACMAPLLLRPLLAGDCELEDDFDMGGDGSIQLLQAAAAANHAQAIVIILLEQYERIFAGDHLQEDSFSSGVYSESEDGDFEDEDDYEDEDDCSTNNVVEEDDGYHDVENDVNLDTEDDPENISSGTHDEGSSDLNSDLYDNKATDMHDPDFMLPRVDEEAEASITLPDKTHNSMMQQNNNQKLSFGMHTQLPDHTKVQACRDIPDQNNCSILNCLLESPGDVPTSASPKVKSACQIPPSCNITKGTDKAKEQPPTVKRPAMWGRTSARKNLSMESIDYLNEDENAIQRLETTKIDLQSKLTKELKENELLQASLERRKEALCERRLALQQDVERLLEQLQKERALRASLEAGLISMQDGYPISSAVDKKTRMDLEEIALAEADIINLKQKVADLHGQLNQPDKQTSNSPCESCSQHQYSNHQSNEGSISNEMEDIQTNKDGERHRKQKCDTRLSERNIDTNTAAAPEHSEKTPRCEDVLSTGTYRIKKPQSQDASSLQNRQSPQKQKSTSQNSRTSAEASSTSAHEPSSTRATAVSQDCTKGENIMFRAGYEKTKTQIHDTPTLPLKQHSQKNHCSAGNVNSSKSLSPARSSSSHDGPLANDNATTKKSSARGEEIVSPSPSALTRLTTRLNFLKEKRVQLVNELQTVDTNRPAGPTTRTNSR